MSKPLGTIRKAASLRRVGTPLAALAGATALIALGATSASAAYTNYNLTANGVGSSSTAALSSSSSYTVAASGLVPNRSYYVSTCVNPGTTSLSAPPSCAFTAGAPKTYTVTSSATGTLSVTWSPSVSFIDVHAGGAPVNCLGATPAPGEVQCAAVVVDAVDHSLAANFDRVLITVD